MDDDSVDLSDIELVVHLAVVCMRGGKGQGYEKVHGGTFGCQSVCVR